MLISNALELPWQSWRIILVIPDTQGQVPAHSIGQINFLDIGRKFDVGLPLLAVLAMTTLTMQRRYITYWIEQWQPSSCLNWKIWRRSKVNWPSRKKFTARLRSAEYFSIMNKSVESIIEQQTILQTTWESTGERKTIATWRKKRRKNHRFISRTIQHEW